MRVLNSAYERLLTAAAVAAVARAPVGRATAGDTAVAPQRGRLPREELDHMIASLGTESYVEGMLDARPYGYRAKSFARWIKKSPGNQWEITDSVAAGLTFLVGCLSMLMLEWRGVDAMNSRGWYLVFPAPVLVAVVWPRRGHS